MSHDRPFECDCSSAKSGAADGGGCAPKPTVDLPVKRIGGLTLPAIEHQALETVRQVEKIIAGEVPVGAVNADRWTRRP